MGAAVATAVEEEGAGSAGVFGQVYASANDRMRNHALVLQLNLFGSFELTDGFLYYLNQESRLTWGFGPFQSLRYRVDTEFHQPIASVRPSSESATRVAISPETPANSCSRLQTPFPSESWRTCAPKPNATCLPSPDIDNALLELGIVCTCASAAVAS